MTQPPRYDATRSLPFGGTLPVVADYGDAAAIVLPIPFDRTTSYVPGTRNGPRELLLASSQVELWDEEVAADVHTRGIHTLPELDLASETLDGAMAIIREVAGRILDDGKFLVTIGGEHSITPPLVAATAARHADLVVVQIDAHADLRDEYHGEPNNHACAMRRALEHAPVVQVGIRNLSAAEAQAIDGLQTTIFYDWNMRNDPDWIGAIVEAVGDRPVYLTIDLDGLDPGLMPAVGTPEPGGLTWRETTSLLRRLFEQRSVVACDVVELCPVPGLASPNFAAARLVYKILSYRLGLPTGHPG